MSWHDPDSDGFTTPLPNIRLALDAGASRFSDLLPESIRTFKFYITITIYVLVLVCSFSFNLLFFILLLFSSKQFRERPFIQILWHVVIANFLITLSNIVITIPLTFAYYSEDELTLFKKSYTYKFFKPLGGFAVELNLILTLVIALQRVLVFLSNRLSILLFRGFLLYVIIGTTWLLTFVITYTLDHFKCMYVWNPTDRMFEYGCFLNVRVLANISPIAETFLVPFLNHIVKFVVFQNVVIPIVVLCGYFIIFYHIYSQRSPNVDISSMAYEKEILKQAFLLFILFEIASIYSLIIPYKPIHTETAFIFNRIDMTLNLLAGALTPALFFTTSTEMRRQLKWFNLIKPKIGVKVVSSFDPPRQGASTNSSTQPPYRYARNTN